MAEAGGEAARAPIPLAVIGGYLGAGKTTLLNHLLRHSRGWRLAVLVNDFGSVSIDAELIERGDGETISLANGCICCGLAGGFALALDGLRERADPPEHIVVEASGVADPREIGQYGHLPGFRLDGAIVVADAETVRRRAADGYVGAQVERQLRGADPIVLNKADLVGLEERGAVERGLRAVAARPRRRGVPRRGPAAAAPGRVPPRGRRRGTRAA